jgi:hypothetical protein
MQDDDEKKDDMNVQDEGAMKSKKFVRLNRDIVPDFIKQRLEMLESPPINNEPRQIAPPSSTVARGKDDFDPLFVLDAASTTTTTASARNDLSGEKHAKTKQTKRRSGCGDDFAQTETARRLPSKKRDLGLTKTQLRHQKENDEYQRKIRPLIDIDMYPMAWDVSRIDDTATPRRVWEFGIGCKGYAPFPGPAYDSFGGNLCGYIELFNSINWGFKDGATAIVVATGTSLGCVSGMESVFVTRERGESRANVPPRVLVAISDLMAENGTIGVSRGGWVVEFAVIHNRFTRVTRPAVAPSACLRFLDVLGMTAELRIVAVFDRPTDAEQRFGCENSMTLDPTFPKEHRGGNEKLHRFTTGTFRLFVEGLASIGDHAHVFAVLLSDPRVYGVASPVVHFGKSLGWPRLGSVPQPANASYYQLLDRIAATGYVPKKEEMMCIIDEAPQSLLELIHACHKNIGFDAFWWVRDVVAFVVHKEEEDEIVSNQKTKTKPTSDYLLACLTNPTVDDSLRRILEEFLANSAFARSVFRKQKMCIKNDK